VSTGLWLGESTATGTVCRTMADATALATTLTDCAQELTTRLSSCREVTVHPLQTVTSRPSYQLSVVA
jgi:hypothetical protein